MLNGYSYAIGFAAVLLAGSTLAAQAGSWGGTVYEVPAPTPAALAVTPTSPSTGTTKPLGKMRHHGLERAAAVHHRDALPAAVAQDTPPAPTPATTVEAQAASGPVELPAPTIRDLVTKHARANGLPEKLGLAVVNIESRFNPKARGGSALGLMQIKYDTARSMGYAGGVTALLTPETNLQFGMKVLADAYRASNGDLCMTLARYQSGHRVTHASAANRAYCARARSYMARVT